MSVCQIILANRPTFRGTVPQKSVGLLPRFLQPRAKRQRKSDTILTLPYPFCGDLVNPHPFIPEFYNHNPSVVLQGIPRGTTRVEISHRNQLGNNQRKVEISTVRAPLFFSAPTLLRRARTRSFRPAGHTLERPWKSVWISVDISGYHAEWKSLQMTELEIS